MECLPIVSFDEMKSIENEAFAKGVSLDVVMGEVAKGIKEWVESFISQRQLPKKICVFAGKGNNGADALWAALLLSRLGDQTSQISIVLPFEVPLLCEKSKALLEQLKDANARIITLEQAREVSFSVVIDGLLGVGVHEGVKEPLLRAIQLINTMKSTIVSVDLPSGLHETFKRDECAVNAHFTLYVSLPKQCYFEKHCWEKIGKLIEIPTPSFQPFYPAKQSHDFLVQERCLDHVIASKRNQNKYEAGYLLLIAGSKGMQGAAKLCAEAAYRSGCGIIRIFGEPLELAEVITEPRKIERFKEEIKRASCVCIGPGLGHDAETKSFFGEALSICKANPQVALILDADALIMLKDPNLVPPVGSILTPHYGELLKLLGLDKKTDEREVFKQARSYAKEHQVVLICKGSPTRIYSQDGLCFVCPDGDPAMATAGMGDVLSGVLSGFTGRGLKPLDAAITGVYLHALASIQSLEEWGLFHLLASDCIRELSNTISKFFHKR